MAYCLWRSGDSWRKLWQRSERMNTDRWDYLDGYRQLQAVLYLPEEEQRLHVAVPVLDPAPTPTIQERNYQKLPRWVLVDRLLSVRPDLIDKKLLMHLPRPKLARMLSEAEAAAAVMDAERRRA